MTGLGVAAWPWSRRFDRRAPGRQYKHEGHGTVFLLSGGSRVTSNKIRAVTVAREALRGAAPRLPPPHVLARATLLTWGSSARNRPGPTLTESSSPSQSGRAVGSSEKPRGPRPRPSRARVCPARPRPRAQCSAVHVAPPSALGRGGRGCLRGTGASRARVL